MIIPPNRDFPITKTGDIAEDRFIGWMDAITAVVNLVKPAEGIVSPEGVVFGPMRSYYFDTAAGRLYFKTTDKSLNTGWVELT